MNIIDQQKYGVSWVIDLNESNMLALFQLECRGIIHLSIHFNFITRNFVIFIRIR
jgi:hypothetical protein